MTTMGRLIYTVSLPEPGSLHQWFTPIIKTRDGRCVNNCGRKPPVKYLRVVRRVYYLPDSYDNLETICQWCADEQDRD